MIAGGARLGVRQLAAALFQASLLAAISSKSKPPRASSLQAKAASSRRTPRRFARFDAQRRIARVRRGENRFATDYGVSAATFCGWQN
jgi:hypothetical protein